MKSQHSFTLIELLVVIGILAILTAAVVLVLNPSELLKQGRDSTRMTDLASMNKTIQLALTQTPSLSLGTASTVYVSLPDNSSSTCGSLGLPMLPTGYTYSCVSAASSTLVNGTGWLPIDFTASGVQSLSKLPIDPSNTSSTSLYYTYTVSPTTQTYELTTILESTKYRLGGPADKVSTDGGTTSYTYEKGTNLSVSPITDTGLVGYWKFDEGSGTQALDASGNNNTGTLTNGPTWQQASTCKVGGCLLFNYGSSTSISIPEPVDNSFDFGLSQSFSVSIFAKIQNPAAYNSFLGKCGQDNSCPGYEFFLNSNTLDFRMTWTGGPLYGIDTTASYDIRDNGWHHVVAVVDRTTFKVFIYVDGILRNNGGNIASVGNIDNSTNLRIGVSGAGPWNGPLDDARVYNRALSPAEVLAIYNSTR